MCCLHGLHLSPEVPLCQSQAVRLRGRQPSATEDGIYIIYHIQVIYSVSGQRDSHLSLWRLLPAYRLLCPLLRRDLDPSLQSAVFPNETSRASNHPPKARFFTLHNGWSLSLPYKCFV